MYREEPYRLQTRDLTAQETFTLQNDGYIFSKSVHGRNLSKAEKQWVLLEDDYANRYTGYYDENGKMRIWLLQDTI